MGDIPYIGGMVINELGKPTKLVPILVSRNDGNTLARTYLSADQSALSAAGYSKILLDSENYDIGNNFASYKYVFPVTGYYQVDFRVSAFTTGNHLTDTFAVIYKDGVAAGYGSRYKGTVCAEIGSSGSIIVYGASGSYVELYVYTNTDSGTATALGGTLNTFMSVHLIST